MSKPHSQASNSDIRSFWEHHPVAAEGIDATLGTRDFFSRFDNIREADDCEPYAYSDMIHGYSSSSNKCVLDIGCGNGYVLSRYAMQGANVFGVDITETAVNLSKRRFELYDLDGHFKTTDGDTLAFPNNQFDIVCTMGVLHHIENPRPMISEIRRVLKPGGKLIMMLYYRYSWKTIVIMRLKRLFHPQYQGKSQQEALNMNDGEDCPLALVYSKSEALELMSEFENHRFRLNQLSWKQLFLIPPLARFLDPVLPSCSDSIFARLMGWNMYIEAIRPSSDL
jgi:2-polyprenyl-3-methyl-5-hydroxy-6-metoxy-1,4-benzoquinol methylase